MWFLSVGMETFRYFFTILVIMHIFFLKCLLIFGLTFRKYYDILNKSPVEVGEWTDTTHKLKPLKTKIFKKFKKTLDILKVLWYT